MNILHVTAHLGGGVGNVLLGLCLNDKHNNHSIICLEEPKNRHYYDLCISSGIQIYSLKSHDIMSLLERADVVQIEWWHHPLITDFMINLLPTVKTRLVVWSHISGCNYPCIPFEFVRVPDAFVFATPYSFDNPFWTESERKIVNELGYLAISSGNDFSGDPTPLKKHNDFVIGYVGFLGYEKTNPDFVKICEGCADIPNVKFVIVGDLKYANDLIKDVNHSNYSDKFIFKGYSSNVMEELSSFDLFACLLHPNHTGASENALLEAMYAKVCPLVMKQCTEQYLVSHGETGMVCTSYEDFAHKAKDLYFNQKLRVSLGENASHYVRNNLSISNTVNALLVVYNDVIKKNKDFHNAQNVFGSSPYEWFNSCYKYDLKNITGLAAGKSKGSLLQYYSYFKDEKLEKLIKENNL